jgi:dTMP kinase
MNSRGKLIVLEGSDAAGKTTQLGLLKAYLEAINLPVKTIEFPRYTDSFYGKMIGSFLKGEYGDLESVNPYLISVIYALDRAGSKEQLENWLKSGSIVISDRYATSNMAHQAGRVHPNKRKVFLSWAEELEYKLNKIPKEDLVIYLHMPYELAKKLMMNKDRKGRHYLKGSVKEITESNETYLRNAEEAYQSLARKYHHWVTITCMDSEKKLKSREEIHAEIKQVLADKGIVK